MRKVLRIPEVLNKVGLSRSTIWRKVRDGKFPPPVLLGGNSIGWFNHEIEEWLEARPRLGKTQTKNTRFSHKDSSPSNPKSRMKNGGIANV